ncbi:unnamed protein product [Lota lota]
MTGLWHRMTLVVVLMCVCLWGTADAVGAAKSRERIVRKPKPDPTPSVAERIPDARPLDLSKLWGKWYLLNLASRCPHQLKHRATSESTFIHITPPEQAESSPISVSTKTRFNHDCWEILQKYYPTKTNGRYLLKGTKRRSPCPLPFNTHVVIHVIIMEVDDAYAFILYHKNGMVTLKLYARSAANLSEPMLTKFEDLAQQHGMSLAYLFPFPTFGHCGSVNKDHVIDCVPMC